MSYIRYHEAEELLRSYQLLKSLLKSLHTSLEHVQQQEVLDDDIYAICMGKHGNGGMPPSGTVSDMTAKIATEYRNSAILKEKEIKKDILEVSALIDKIEIGLNSLMGLQRTIIEQYYWGKPKTWAEVINNLKDNNLYLGVSQAKRIRERGIKRFMSAARIEVAAYKKVMEILNG